MKKRACSEERPFGYSGVFILNTHPTIPKVLLPGALSTSASWSFSSNTSSFVSMSFFAGLSDELRERAFAQTF